jgi:hypothetical protein
VRYHWLSRRRGGRPSRAVLLAALLAGPVLWAADPPPGGDDWKYDVVYRKKGKPLQGLVVEETPARVLLKCVTRKPGAPTLVFTESLPRDDVDHIDLLGPREREILARRLDALKKERELLATQLKALDPAEKAEASAGEQYDLRPAPWVLDGKSSALAYQSAHFRLVSNAGEKVIELAVLQLEQVYGAYVRTLPPRTAPETTTTIVLTRSLADYQALVRGQGHNLLNPAFYDAGKNRIVCANDLQAQCDELERTRRFHDKKRAELKQREEELQKVYGGKVPAEVLAPVEEARKGIRAAEQRNEAAFRQAQRRLFQRLSHEAFHAYLATCVYPASEGEVPRWLNEGLAQIFETALVEAGELRMGHADKERLDAVRAALRKGALLPLAELLRSGPRQFQVAHAAERQASDRHYLASWALAFYLTFERRLLGTRALDDYVKATGRGDDPLKAFEELVGQPLPEFEKAYLEYLKNLRPDGTTAKGEGR